MYSGARSEGKGQFEESSFPVVCEDCLGSDVYVRMMKAPFDNECKLCSRPFTTFRWRPGGKGKYVTTEICQTCAKLRNACQACILDLVYKLPVGLRDQITPSSSTLGAQPVMTDDVHREYFADQAERRLAAGEKPDFSKAPPAPKLVGVAKTLAPALQALGIVGAKGGNQGQDTGGKTLFIGGVGAAVSEKDLRAAFAPYGEIEAVQVKTEKRIAFAEFRDREGAEAAFVGTGGTIAVGAVKLICNVSWAKGNARGGRGDGGAGGAAGAGAAAPPPPPGIASLSTIQQYYPSSSGAMEGAPRKK